MNTSRKYGARRTPRQAMPEKASFMDHFRGLLTSWEPAFKQFRTFERVVNAVVGLLACQGRGTLTNSIMYRGREQADWSADYKAFNRSEWKASDIFRSVLLEAIKEQPVKAPLVLALDDTSLPKTGTKIPQARWCHDPLAPKFLDMPIQWGIRMLHAAIIVPNYVNHRPLALSVAFEPIPAVEKVRETGGLSEAELAALEAAKKEASLTTRAVRLVENIRKSLDEGGEKRRRLLVVADSSFTNGATISHLPANTEFIGRFRKNARIYAPTEKKEGKRIYGEVLPTPEQFRQDPEIPFRSVELHYGGGLREIRFKEIQNILWKDGTRGRVMRLLIVMPIPYKVVGRRKRGYNNPAYLLTTDLTSPAAQLVQAYLDRWQIEVLHRDLKAGIGVGQVQAFSHAANERVHGATVAAYSMLNLAGLRTFNGKRTEDYPDLPAWRKRKPPMRPSQHDLVSMLRNNLADVWTQEQGRMRRPKGWVLSHHETYQAA